MENKLKIVEQFTEVFECSYETAFDCCYNLGFICAENETDDAI